MTGKHWPPLSNNRCDISPMLWTTLNFFRQQATFGMLFKTIQGSPRTHLVDPPPCLHSGNQREKENEEEEENNPMKGKIDKCVRIHTFIYTRERNRPSKGNI